MPWKQYRRTGLSEMRPYIAGESLAGISVSPEDCPTHGGMIARNPTNHADKRYVAKKYFEENLELAGEGYIWKQYRAKSTRTYIAELRDYNQGEDTSFIQLHSMTPQEGDKIARHLTDHSNQWLIQKEFFDKEMEPVT